MSYYEFTDGLLAVALYCHPNPFQSPKDRIGPFIVDCLIAGLMKYCSKYTALRKAEHDLYQRRTSFSLQDEDKEQQELTRSMTEIDHEIELMARTVDKEKKRFLDAKIQELSAKLTNVGSWQSCAAKFATDSRPNSKQLRL